MMNANRTTILMAILLACLGVYLFRPVWQNDAGRYLAAIEAHPLTVLPGNSEITGCRVIERNDKTAKVEVDYFYNGAEGRTFILAMALMPSDSDKRGDYQTLLPVEVGRHKQVLTLPRAFDRPHAYQTTEIVVRLLKTRTSIVTERRFPESIAWAALDPSLMDKPDAAKLDELYKQAVKLVDMSTRDSLEEAKRLLDRILLSDPNYVPAYAEVARYHMKTNWNGQGLAQAEEMLKAALSKNPRHANTLVLLGYVYAHQKRYQEAEATLKEAERIGTENRWLDSNWAELMLMQRRIPDAVKRYELVISKPRTYDSNDRAREDAYNHLAEIYLAQEDLDKADKVFGRQAADFPEDGCFLSRHAEFKLTKRGDYDAAIKLAHAALDHGCDDGNSTKRFLGAAYYTKWNAMTKADPAEREQIFNRALVLQADIPQLYAYLATSARTTAVIPALKGRGYDIDAADREGLTALALAIQKEDKEAVRRLIKYKANVNKILNENGWTPFMLAVISRNKEIAEILVMAGADIKAKTRDGVTAEMIARQLGMEEIAKLAAGGGV